MENQLIAAVDLVRHGDRHPLARFPIDHEEWPKGVGMLTSRGITQSFAYGQSLRRLWVDEHKLVDPLNLDSLWVRCSEVQRTRDTAFHILRGMISEGLATRIPIFKKPLHEDVELLKMHTHSQEHQSLLQELVFHQEEVKKRYQSYRDSYPEWQRLVGVPLTKDSTVTILADSLYIRSLTGSTLPPTFPQEEATKIIAAGHDYFIALFKHETIGTFLTSELQASITEFLAKAAHDPKHPRYGLIVGHDSTIAPLMSSPGFPLDTPPPYLATVRFTLWKNCDALETKIEYQGKYL